MRPTLALVAVLTLLVAGCGHPATDAECQVVFDKVVDLELDEQKVTDPTQRAARHEEAKSQRGQALMDHCRGKRITDGALACVARATTYDQINDVCLR